MFSRADLCIETLYTLFTVGCFFVNTYWLLTTGCRHFEILDKDDPVAAARLFSIPDFVGDACKAVASRVRGAVAGVPFDELHKVSRNWD